VCVDVGKNKKHVVHDKIYLHQVCCLSPILFNLYSEYLTKGALEGFGDFKIGHVIRTVKYADDLVLLATAPPRAPK
jgi:hypothetical protein